MQHFTIALARAAVGPAALGAWALTSAFSVCAAAPNAKSAANTARLQPPPAHPKQPSGQLGAKPAPAPKTSQPVSLHAFIANRCLDCHDSDLQKGGLDLSAMKYNFTDPREFPVWVKVHDRVRD